MSKNLGLTPIIVIVAVFFLLVLSFNFSIRGSQQFSYLAQSFLEGKTYFPENFFTPEVTANTGLIDTVKINDRHYWPLSPIPSLLLAPFVLVANWFGVFFLQGYLQFFLTLGVFYLCFLITKKYGYSPKDAVWLAFAFVFASTYHLAALLSYSWYFVQVITVFFAFLGIYEWFGKKRYWLIGLALAVVFASRFTAGLAVIFFIADLFLSKNNYSPKKKIACLAWLIIPIILAGTMLLFYNQVRFGDIFENGFRLANNSTLNESQRFELRNYGLFQIRNIPTNFYYYFLKTVDPVRLNVETLHGQTYVLAPPYLKVDYPGVGFLVTAPIFLYLFRLRFKSISGNSFTLPSLITIIPILLLLLMYYWPGWIQIGPRYLLDLLPFAFLLLLTVFSEKKLSSFAKAIVVLSSLLNLYLFFAFLIFQ